VPAAFAQSSAAGTVYGDVAPSATIVLKNLDTNATRTATADSAGKFQVTALPIGRYRATSGNKTADIEVLAGQGVEAAFTEGAVQTVQITSRRTRIDVSNATNGATFTARELAKLPIAKSVCPTRS
jgi:hypothetical protein